MKLIRKLLILSHRYLGIVLSLMVVMWFATGIVMMYAGGMPRLSPQMRLERMAPVDLSQVRLSPAEAGEKADVRGRPVLLTVLDRPAYRFSGRSPITVFADTGEIMQDLTPEQSRTVASRFLRQPEDKVRLMETVTEVDQWTLAAGGARLTPIYKFAVDDGEGTEIYVQPQTGEILVFTTARSRMLAWAGVIPHWLYFTALRTDQPLWYKTVVWTSAAACVVAFLGLVLGAMFWKKTKPFSLSKSIPYSGWMRWHYITGAVFGVFTLTWAFSGLLSMEPFEWTRAEGLEVQRDVFTGGAVDLGQFAAMKPAEWNGIMEGRAVKEVEFARIQDEHYYVVRHQDIASEEKRRERLHQPYYITGRAESNRLIVNAKTLEARQEAFSAESLVSRLEHAIPDVPILEQQLLTEYDDYYYSRGQLTPLPVLRVKFADPAQTWVYIDPETSQILSTIPKLARVERWLYNGLHSLDFSFWYNRRPLWDVGMITLCVGGLFSSAIGLFLGVKRLGRGVVPKRQGAAPADSAEVEELVRR